MKCFGRLYLVMLALSLFPAPGLAQDIYEELSSSPSNVAALSDGSVLADRNLEFRFARAIQADDGAAIADLARRGLNVNAELPNLNGSYAVAKTDLVGLMGVLGVDLQPVDEARMKVEVLFRTFGGWSWWKVFFPYAGGTPIMPKEAIEILALPVDGLAYRRVTVPYARSTVDSITVDVVDLRESYPAVPRDIYMVSVSGLSSGRPLIIAVLQKRMNALDGIAGAGGNVDQGDEGGATPLMVASGVGSLDAMQVLLRHGADVSIADAEGYAASHWAARGGSSKALEVLRERGAAVDARNLMGQTPLILAAQYGHAGAVETLLSHGARIDGRDGEGRSPLLHAAAGDMAQACGVLLDAGAKIEERDSAGMTPLMCAATARAPRSDPAEALAARAAGRPIEGEEAGTEPAASMRLPKTSVIAYGQTGRMEVSRWPAAPMRFRVYAGGGTMRLLLDRGADMNARDKTGNTPLMHAARDGRAAAVGLLMDSGADYLAKNENGRRAKDLARENHQRETAHMLGWWDPRRVDARLGGNYSSISHSGQAMDLGWEAGGALSLRFNRRLSLYNEIRYAFRVSDITGRGDVPGIPDAGTHNEGFYKFSSLEYCPAIRLDLPPLRRPHFYLLGGLSVGKVLSASQVLSDGGGAAQDLGSLVNETTYGWHAAAGIDAQSMFLEIRKSRNTTDVFKDWSGSFGSWTVTLGARVR